MYLAWTDLTLADAVTGILNSVVVVKRTGYKSGDYIPHDPTDTPLADLPATKVDKKNG